MEKVEGGGGSGRERGRRRGGRGGRKAERTEGWGVDGEGQGQRARTLGRTDVPVDALARTRNCRPLAWQWQ